MTLSTPAHTSEQVLAQKLAEAESKIEVGAIYVHYRNPNQPYKVLAIGLLEATEEPCVIYQAQYGSNIMQNTIWVRAVDVWLAEVSLGDKKVARFQKIQ